MFEGFATHAIRCEDSTIHCRVGGRGTPLLLLHGFPQTHAHWHRLAPLLEGEFSLVIPDLRGYGAYSGFGISASRGPAPDPQHRSYCKREMAEDMVELMSRLGHERFGILAHDRGARVGYRLALDSPRRVSHLVSLDTVPTLDIWDAWDMAAPIEAFHWTFLAQPAPVPERMMDGDPDFFITHLLERWSSWPGVLDPAVVEAYKAAFRKPEVRQAMAEDYRAGATIDLALDREDRTAGRRLKCPVLAPRGRLYTAEPLRRRFRLTPRRRRPLPHRHRPPRRAQGPEPAYQYPHGNADRPVVSPILPYRRHRPRPEMARTSADGWFGQTDARSRHSAESSEAVVRRVWARMRLNSSSRSVWPSA